jgi:hypothetical protein
MRLRSVKVSLLVSQAHTQSITLLHMFKGSFIITGTVDGRVSIWNFEFEEAFSSGAFFGLQSQIPFACARQHFACHKI